MTDWNISTDQDSPLGLATVIDEITTLTSSILSALQENESIQPIWELHDGDQSIGRSVIQFRVDEKLFDTFFNSSRGYRSFFRRGPWLGSALNSFLVMQIKSALFSKVSDPVQAHILKDGPKLCGTLSIEQSKFLRSFDPSLSKIWFSTAVVDSSGQINLLPSGISNERLNVGLEDQWMRINQGPEECFIEVKGAFVGPNGLFQVKEPEKRALTLSERGEA